MLKKVLILIVALYTPHILPAHNPSRLENFSLGTSLLLAVPGIMCARLYCKNINKLLQANEEIARQFNNLRGMGVKVSEKLEGHWFSNNLTETFVMEIPANFSLEQRKQAKKYFNILSANHKIHRSRSLDFDISVTGFASLVLLAPIIMHIVESCRGKSAGAPSAVS